MAQITFKDLNNWTGTLNTRSQVSRFSMGGMDLLHKDSHTIETDMPSEFLGGDQGATPAEHALQALAACMNTTMIYNCAARGIEVRSSTIQIEGDLDARKFLHINSETRPGYQGIRVIFEVDADASAEELEFLSKSSPMFDVFTNGVPVEVKTMPPETV